MTVNLQNPEAIAGDVIEDDELSDTALDRRRTGEVRARVHGRSARVVQQVLSATFEELGRVGYAAMKIDDVAARAGVNKTTVYRRWPSKLELVRAASRTLAESNDSEPPDLGCVREDLLEIVRRAKARWGTPEGRAMVRLIGAERSNPEIQALCRSMRDDYFARHAPVVARALARGELPPGTDGDLVMEVVFAAVHSRLVKLGETPADHFLANVVDLVLQGARHGGAVPKPTTGSTGGEA